MSAKSVETVVASGTEVLIPLNKLKKSPNNARKTPHSEASIEAYAASIAAKGILQNLVVEPELDGDGLATGFYFVTIGEGRRLAQLLRVKRKEIKKTEPIRCIVDTANDPHEISSTKTSPGRTCTPPTNSKPSRNWPRSEVSARRKSPPGLA
jgi:ParB family transcriptional regulator, chromosome partitioning protein